MRYLVMMGLIGLTFLVLFWRSSPARAWPRVLVFLIGLTFMLLALLVPEAKFVFIVCAGILHGLVLVDIRTPGTIERLIE